jgi:Undecaprenyl-phosphate glucose phosphotransferase
VPGRDAHVFDLKAKGLAFGRTGEAASVTRPTNARASRRLPISLHVLEGAIQFSDILLFLIGLAVSFTSFPDLSLPARNNVVLAVILGSLATLLLLHRGRSHALPALRSAALQARVSLTSFAIGFTVVLTCVFFFGRGEARPGTVAMVWLLPPLALQSLFRCLLWLVVRCLTASGHLTRNIAVIGTPKLAQSFVARAASRSDLRVTGVFDDSETARPGFRLSEPADALLEHCRRGGVDTIVIAVALSEPERIAELRCQISATVADVYVATEFAELRGASSGFTQFANEPMLLVHERPLKDWNAVQKRLFDLVAGSLLLTMLAVPMGVIALLIKLESPGPAIFRQPRLGFDNVPFTIFKFRSMYHHMSDVLAEQQTTRDDRRVTRLGQRLRKLGLDELPQLFNVLAGDMSLVGPRPHALNTKAGEHQFVDVVATYALRHRVKPGITGWAQVNGCRGETRTVPQIENRVAHDLHYIENWSLLLDAKILFLTVLREVFTPNAY